MGGDDCRKVRQETQRQRAERIGKEHGISRATVERCGKYVADLDILKAVDPDIEQKAMAGQGPTLKQASGAAAALLAGRDDLARAFLADSGLPSRLKAITPAEKAAAARALLKVCGSVNEAVRLCIEQGPATKGGSPCPEA
jgi:hypothetical protein